MESIWVVRGETGEHSDHFDWFVCAYADEALAKEHAANAEKVADKIMIEAKSRMEEALGYWPSFIGEMRNSYDANMTMDYTGTWYTAIQVPFIGQED